MIIRVTMPVLGLTMEQGTLVAWLKEIGDRVEADEPLFMVETDKATSDAPAPAAGILAKILHQEGETVLVGTVIALLAETPADVEDVSALGAASAPVAPTPEAAAGPPGAVAPVPREDPGAAAGAVADRVSVSPRARARAKEFGIDLSVAAPGAGRLTEKDVLALAAAATPAADQQIKKLSRTRKIIAERMTLSATTIPQVTYALRCDVTDALALRRSLKAGLGGERNAVSFDALVVRAAALALVDHPEVNSQWVEGQGIRMMTEVNVAVAVDLDDKGLVIPVIHRADALDIRGAAAELDRLVAGARAGKLGPDDYAGGTFTITSLASLGVETFNPIIVPPQAAILGVGAMVPTPVFQQDRVVKRRLLTLALTTDHRILDGGPSARFLGRIKDLLEQPGKLA